MPNGSGRGGGGCGRGGGRGDGGAGRGSLIEPAILVALATAASHGYDLRASVEELTCGFLVVDPGGLYRALRRMEDDGLIASTWTEGEHGPQRRTYRITDDGRDVLALWAERLGARRRALDGLLQAMRRLEGTDVASPTTAGPGSEAASEESDDASQ